MKDQSSSIYLMPSILVLHPGLKLEYFRRHDWEDEWIEQAENMVREEYISVYENKATAQEDIAIDVLAKVSLSTYTSTHHN